MEALQTLRASQASSYSEWKEEDGHFPLENSAGKLAFWTLSWSRVACWKAWIYKRRWGLYVWMGICAIVALHSVEWRLTSRVPFLIILWMCPKIESTLSDERSLFIASLMLLNENWHWTCLSKSQILSFARTNTENVCVRQLKELRAESTPLWPVVFCENKKQQQNLKFDLSLWKTLIMQWIIINMISSCLEFVEFLFNEWRVFSSTGANHSRWCSRSYSETAPEIKICLMIFMDA